MQLKALLAVATAVTTLGLLGCGTGSKFEPDAGIDPDAEGSGDDSGDPFQIDGSTDAVTCVGLECLQVDCGGGATTSISGTVYAPNGTLPLYNVIVYVPNSPLDPFTAGVTCDNCGVVTSGSPLVVALTDAQGKFILQDMPVGPNIPVVMQIGKWRRQFTVPQVDQCKDTPVSKKVGNIETVTRLPKNQKEGDMPKIAVTTGGCDKLSCILPKIGIDATEYAAGPTSSTTKPTKAISFYSGGSSGAPTGSPPAQPFWNDEKQLKNFDLAIFSCECTEPGDANATSYAAVRKYLEAGGRVFTTDFMYVWYKFSTDTNLNAAPWSWPGGAPSGGQPDTIITTFPKGKALSDWLYYVSGIDPYKSTVITYPPVKSKFPATLPYGYTFDNIHGINPKYGTAWVQSGPYSDPNGSPQNPRVVTMNMPSALTPDKQCGKGVHLDLHITQDDQVNSSFPTGCSANMREPELVTTFFLFDVSSCIQDDKIAPIPPIPK